MMASFSARCNPDPCVLCVLLCVAVDLQSKITPSNGKKVTGKDFNAYLAANKVRR